MRSISHGRGLLCFTHSQRYVSSVPARIADEWYDVAFGGTQYVLVGRHVALCWSTRSAATRTCCGRIREVPAFAADGERSRNSASGTSGNERTATGYVERGRRYSSCVRAGLVRIGITSAAAAALLVSSAAAAHAPATRLLPHSCPSLSLVRSTLHVKANRVTTYTSELEYPYGSPALPVKRAPAYQKTCVYAADGKFSGQIVPTTISFAAVVTKKDFASARKNASRSVKPFGVPRLGDAAWAVAPPKFDPRAGASLFVLKGSVDIVLTAPNQASVGRLVKLARRLV
jgi:hypothetical protein